MPLLSAWGAGGGKRSVEKGLWITGPVRCVVPV